MKKNGITGLQSHHRGRGGRHLQRSLHVSLVLAVCSHVSKGTLKLCLAADTSYYGSSVSHCGSHSPTPSSLIADKSSHSFSTLDRRPPHALSPVESPPSRSRMHRACPYTGPIERISAHSHRFPRSAAICGFLVIDLWPDPSFVLLQDS